MQPRLNPPLPAPVSRAARGAFGRLSGLRAARVFHPRGVSFAARMDGVGPDRPTGSPFLDRPGAHAALVRFSKGAGLPDPVPDVLGLAVRVLDADGPGLHRDLLFASSASAPGLRHLLVPARSFSGRTLSSILPYRTSEGRWVLAAACPRGAPSFHGLLDGMPPPAVTLLAAHPTGAWRPFATLRADARLSETDSAALAFDPWNAAPDLVPAGWLNALRRPAYAGSRRARPRDDPRGERP